MKDLFELTDKNNLNKNVKFVGKVPWDDVPKYYQIADVFATASTTETQGLTVIEAMAASKPVVAIKDESFELVITDKQDGFFFVTDDEYKELINKLYSDKKLSNKISRQARITANSYSAEVYASRVLEIYKMVVNKDTNLFKKAIHSIKNVIERSEK